MICAGFSGTGGGGASQPSGTHCVDCVGPFHADFVVRRACTGVTQLLDLSRTHGSAFFRNGGVNDPARAFGGLGGGRCAVRVAQPHLPEPPW